MAEEHVKALLALGFDPAAILVAGRGRERVEEVGSRYGVGSTWGGVEALETAPAVAVVAVGEEHLAPAALALVERGATALLVEKPGALASSELAAFAEAIEGRATAFVAYNRRFYPSVDRARELIEEDGGPLSAAFELTEVEELVLRDAERRGLAPATLARWGLANSLHVVDLAFFLIGAPARLACDRAGALDWHPSGAVFTGNGRSECGALFSYWGTWSGAGRWGVEVSTPKRKLVLRPLEELRQQVRGSFALDPVDLGGSDGLKAGVRPQLEAFLAAASGGPVDRRLCGLDDASRLLQTGERLFGYETWPRTVGRPAG